MSALASILSYLYVHLHLGVRELLRDLCRGETSCELPYDEFAIRTIRHLVCSSNKAHRLAVRTDIQL
jgi:hypothetical protein